MDFGSPPHGPATVDAVAHPLTNRTIVPMKGKSGELPIGDQWVYELKWDGMRVIAFIHDGMVRLQSSNERDVTVSFPELQALASVGESFDGLVLDGEVVAFDGARPSFNTLQSRMHVTDASDAARRSATTPVIFVAFDLLHLDGHDTTSLPLQNRRTLLEQLSNDDPSWTICEQHDDNVQGLIDAVTAAGLEGIMAKNRSSVYQPSRRSPDWIKLKPRLRQEFVVGGWISGQGQRSGGLGSLLVGYYDGENLRFAGRAGSGLTQTSQQQWKSLLITSAACPFVEAPSIPRDRLVHWCEPNEVVEIAFGEWGTEGQNLRHPVVVGRRTDKSARDVVREH